MTRRAGQAAVEFTVAVVCILLVTTALLQLVIFADADTGTMAEATARASDAATGGGLATSFSPVRDWSRGRDGLIFTSDDAPRAGNFASVRSDIAAKTAPDGDWTALDRTHSIDLRTFAQYGNPTVFGFVRGEAAREIEVLPAARILLGLRSPAVGNEAWSVRVGGLY